MIHIHFKIKFRFAGMTLGTVEQTVPLNIPGILGTVIPSFHTTVYNDRGVFIEAYK